MIDKITFFSKQNMIIDNKEYVSTVEAAEILSVHPTTVHNLCKRGALTSIKHPVFNWRIIPKEDIDNFISGKLYKK